MKNNESMHYPPGLPADVGEFMEGIGRVVAYEFTMARSYHRASAGFVPAEYEFFVTFTLDCGQDSPEKKLQSFSPIFGVVECHDTSMYAKAYIVDFCEELNGLVRIELKIERSENERAKIWGNVDLSS